MNRRNIIKFIFSSLSALLIIIFLLTACLVPGTRGLKINKADSVNIFIDGIKLKTNSPPLYVNNHLMLPAGEVFDALGAEVTWDEESQMLEAFKEDMHITMYADADYASVNNMIRMFKVPVKLIEDQLMAPYGFIADAMDCKVTGDDVSGDIQIYTAPSFYDELPKSEIDFSISASDIRFIDRSSGFDIAFIKTGILFEIIIKVFKNTGSPAGGGKAKLFLDDFHIDTIPFFIDKNHSHAQVNMYYIIPINRYNSLAPD